MEEIISAIANIGFPIVVCLIMIKNNKDMTTAHQEESKGFIQAIDNNTMVLKSLEEALRREE